VAETTTQIIQENPQIEAYRLALLNDVQQFIQRQLSDQGIQPAPFQIAGLTDMQQEAALKARQGLGSYSPYLQSGLDSLRSGQAYGEQYGYGGLQEGFGAVREGQEALSQAAQLAAQQRAQPQAYRDEAANILRGATGAGYQALVGSGAQFQPDMIRPFMNPYEDLVVQQAMKDIRREGDIREQGLQAQAAAQGAFGGSRQAVAEQELGRNVMEQQARTSGQLRMGGYQNAGDLAQLAFENAQRRRQQSAQLYGGLGQQSAQALAQMGLGYGQLSQGDVDQLIRIAAQSGQLGQGLGSLGQAGMGMGTQMGSMGLQEAGLGQLGQQMNLMDVKTLEALGGRDQQIQQAILDAQRQSNTQMQQFPYQQFAFLSDIYKGTPSSQQVTQISQQQQPSAAQQLGGIGIAALSGLGGAKQMGLFG
jgi:hypothetical protein